MLNFINKIKDRLFTRLLLSHLLIVSLPLFFTGKVLIDTAQSSIQKTILDRNLEFAHRSTRFIELKLNTAAELIKSQAQFQSLYEMNQTTQELAINTLVSEFDLFSRLSILDTLGNLIASTAFEEESLQNMSNGTGVNNILQQLINDGEYQTDVYLSEELLPVLDFAEPIKSFDRVVAVLYATVDLTAMWDIVDENIVGEKGEAFIFNKDGVYIAHSDRKKVYSRQTFLNEELVEKVRRGESGATIYADESIEMVAAYAPIGNYGWGAMIQQPTSEAFAPAKSMRLRVIEAMIVSAFLASLLAYIFSKNIVNPVQGLVSGMQRFSKGELNYRIEKVGHDEIGTLSQNFNHMADRLVEFQNTLKKTERLETLGKLASVLSHEIRNPLNSMVINMQILKREFSKQKIDRQKVERFYEILNSEIKRVDRLVSDFLLIARPQKLQKKEVQVDKILDEVVVTQVVNSLKKGVRVERQYENSGIKANIDAARMMQVFLNLSLNAIQSMPGGGKLTIVLKNDQNSTDRVKNNSILISFTDTGHGIPKKELNKIFDFYYSTKKDGSGLGLAIVQQIVDDHGGYITVESKVNKGTTFTVSIPRN